MNRSLLNQRYVRLRKLAEGGMGEIFLARQTGLAGFQREVVVKVIHQRLSDHPKAVDMFLDEARLAAALCHPNIVHIYDVGQEEGSYFIVMERILGTDLRALAEATTRLAQMIPMELSVNIIVQVLEGLRYAHGFRDETGRPLKIVHRDVNPTNILISFDGSVKIVDFGIARAAHQLRDETGMRPGKFSYMSPELVRGDPIDARADLFSVGVMLYELTVGQRLFRATSYEAMRRVVDEPIPPPTFSRAGYPVDLEIIVMRALERDPGDRYGSAGEMLEELEQFAFGTGLRMSRLRLGRFVSKITGVSSSALEVDESQPGEGGGEELDFDRELFEGPTAPDPEPSSPDAERVRHVAEAVQQANEAIADLVATLEPEEENTAQIRLADQAVLRARSVGPEPEGGEPEPGPAPADAPAPASKESTQVVTAEQVEEEIDLIEPADDVLVPPSSLEAPPAPREGTLELSLEDVQDASEDESEPLFEARREPEVIVPPPARHEPSQPEASADLRAALAEISAELKAAEASDRRREEALAHALQLIGDDTDLPAGSLQGGAGSVRPTHAVEDELEQADGELARHPDALELADLRPDETPPPTDEELEADGEPIELDADESMAAVAPEDSSAPRRPPPSPPTPPPEAPVETRPEAAAVAPAAEAAPVETRPPPEALPQEASPPAESEAPASGTAPAAEETPSGETAPPPAASPEQAGSDASTAHVIASDKVREDECTLDVHAAPDAEDLDAPTLVQDKDKGAAEGKRPRGKRRRRRR